ncbi:uncharacterized protein LOC136031218 isoform X4 [Artemia franciscana]|uniref:uncharacterized protein LOC136031218 isoform X4 n=1 Tax=Artemia franciscana TaxID=6661 RepID=UPI0032D9CA2C
MHCSQKLDSRPYVGRTVVVSSRKLIRDIHNKMGQVDLQEKIILTPRKKTAKSTIISIERRRAEAPEENGVDGSKVFVAGGPHKGIVIQKDALAAIPDNSPPKLTLEFRVFLVSSATNEHSQESRTLWFWFKDGLFHTEEACSAQEFFKDLVSPVDFPRDYVGFIKKIMKLMQTKYPQIQKVEVELRHLEPVERSSFLVPRYGYLLLNIGIEQASQEMVDYESDNLIEVTEAIVLEIIESSFPNPISVSQIANQTRSDPRKIVELLTSLQNKRRVKTIGGDNFTRMTKNEDNIKVVRQMPRIIRSQQPTVAIITAKYCEKLAVDAMIDDLETFVRFNTVGESNVYSLGTIGNHRVVATKLPSVGNTREAMIVAGNTTTRLLGTFQAVEHVFLVGVAGGVPHYTDSQRHIRLGDVVVSAPIQDKRFIYMYCEEKRKQNLNNSNSQMEENVEIETKTWCPPDLQLQDIAENIRHQDNSVYISHFHQGLEILSDQDISFLRPPPESDKLYMSIGGNDLIEVNHPTDRGNEIRTGATPRLHLGPIGCGYIVSRNDILRQEISYTHGILAYDSEFDQVLESIYGNRKDNYVVIRGISDYVDGTGGRGKEWQAYASLVASSVMKAMILELPNPVQD